MEYNEQIDTKLQTIEQIIEFTKGAKLIMAIDSKTRSTIWHDTTTNNRGKMMEDFIASKQLYKINEDSPSRTFQSTKGESNIDLTIVNNNMLAGVTGWEIADVESASDHNILKFSINLEADKLKGNTPELKYIIKEKQSTEFYNNLFHTISKNFQIEITGGSAADIDEEMHTRLTGHTPT
jgi:hypothetical protein